MSLALAINDAAHLRLMERGSSDAQNPLPTLFFFLDAICDISHRLGGITPYGVFSDAFPGLKMWVTFACATAIFLTRPFYNLNCSARERAP
jgi:hypothetical protein